MNYAQLHSWRNICEFLEEQPYNFAESYLIRKKVRFLPICLSTKHQEDLFNRYLIQLVHSCRHPITRYTRSRKIWKEYDIWGWQLCKNWEFQIDYLENLVIFSREPESKPWEPELRKYQQLRAEREAKLRLKKELQAMKPDDAIAKAHFLGICYRCFEKIPYLMVDCVKCGARQ